MNLTIRWHGTVKGQPRVRATRAGGFVRMYTPDTADAMKAGLVALAMEQMQVQDWDRDCNGSVIVRIHAHFQRPKSHFRGGILRPDSPITHAQKPDIDNIAKAVLDAFTTARVWRDDAQVCHLEVSRAWAYLGCPPGLRVEVSA